LKPDVGRFLEVAMAHLLGRTVPALSGYDQSSVMLLATLLGSVREEFERAAARRVAENRELRRLFAEAVSCVEDAGLEARLREAAAKEDVDLAVSALEAANAGLRELLIELHAHVEELGSEAARGVEAAIWRELQESTERRRLGLGPF
jgi:hypothetical protein